MSEALPFSDYIVFADESGDHAAQTKTKGLREVPEPLCRPGNSQSTVLIGQICQKVKQFGLQAR